MGGRNDRAAPHKVWGKRIAIDRATAAATDGTTKQASGSVTLGPPQAGVAQRFVAWCSLLLRGDEGR